MNIVCLDMEGVLVPEIWIAFAEESGIPDSSGWVALMASVDLNRKPALLAWIIPRSLKLSPNHEDENE